MSSSFLCLMLSVCFSLGFGRTSRILAVPSNDPYPYIPQTPPPHIPISKSVIQAPSVLQFPGNSVVGSMVSIQVNVTVDVESSAPQEDFYFLADATGSMRQVIERTREEFGTFIASRRAVSDNVAFGVGYYRDERDRPAFENLQSITVDETAAQRAIDSVRAQGGRDLFEANLLALSTVATSGAINWREGSRKVLVYFGDAPGHEPTCPLPGVRHTRSSVSEELNAKGITVVAQNFGGKFTGLNLPTISFGCSRFSISAPGQGSDIASATNGVFRVESDSGGLIQGVLDAVGTLDQEISADTTDCDGKVAIRFDPKLPISVSPGETTSIFESAEILPGACNLPGGVRCTIDLSLSGVNFRQVVQTTFIEC